MTSEIRTFLLIFLLLCVTAFAGELVTNGDFSAWDDADTPTGWLNTTTTANSEISQQNAGAFHNGPGTGSCNIWTDDNITTSISQDSILTIGTMYRLRFDMWDNGGDLKVTDYPWTANYKVFDGTGVKVFYFTAIDEGISFIRNGATTDITIDNVSIIAADSLNCYAGGSAASTDHTGFSNLEASVSCGANGQSLHEDDELADTEGSGGKMVITTATDLTDITGAFCNVTVNRGTEGTGRYEIIAVNTAPSGADTILINLDWVDDGDDRVDIVIGGAIPNTYNVAAYDLEDALDNTGSHVSTAIAAGGDVDFFITGTTDTGETIQIDTIEGASNNWVHLIGADTDYLDTATGTQGWTITAAAAFPTGNLLRTHDKERIQFKNIALLDNDENGGAPIVGDGGIRLNSTGGAQYGFLVENCSFDNCYIGLFVHANSFGTIIKDCTVGETTVCVNDCIENDAAGTVIVGGYYKGGGAGTTLLDIDAACTIDGAVLFGENYGVALDGVGQHVISNCIFYNQNYRALSVNDAGAHALIYNNIFYVTTPASHIAIEWVSGSYTEYNNITNADTLALSGFVNSTGYNLGFTNTDPFVNASGGDFRINWGNTIANTYVIDQGYAPYLGASTTGTGKANLGAFNYQQAKGRHRSVVRKGN